MKLFNKAFGYFPINQMGTSNIQIQTNILFLLYSALIFSVMDIAMHLMSILFIGLNLIEGIVLMSFGLPIAIIAIGTIVQSVVYFIKVPLTGAQLKSK